MLLCHDPLSHLAIDASSYGKMTKINRHERTKTGKLSSGWKFSPFCCERQTCHVIGHSEVAQETGASFVTTEKSRHFNYHLKEAEMKITYVCRF